MKERSKTVEIGLSVYMCVSICLFASPLLQLCLFLLLIYIFPKK